MNRRELLAGAIVLGLPKTAEPAEEAPDTFMRMYSQHHYDGNHGKILTNKPIAGIHGVYSTRIDNVYFVDRLDDRKFEVKFKQGKCLNDECSNPFYSFEMEDTLKILQSQLLPTDNFHFVVDEGYIKAVPNKR